MRYHQLQPIRNFINKYFSILLVLSALVSLGALLLFISKTFTVTALLALIGLSVFIFLFWQLRQKEKLIKDKEQRFNDSMEQFAYITAHDLQEPLRNISSYSQLLKKKCPDDLSPEASEYLNFIISETKRMKDLYSELIRYSDLGIIAQNTSQVDLFTILKDISDRKLQKLSEQHKTQVPLVTYDHLPSIEANQQQIYELFVHLFDNALKFSKEERPQIHISTKQLIDSYLISFKDNGSGIKKDHLKRIFSIFQRLDNKRQGSGMGLALCKKIVTMHGGEIWASSEEGKGTTISFSLPIFELRVST